MGKSGDAKYLLEVVSGLDSERLKACGAGEAAEGAEKGFENLYCESGSGNERGQEGQRERTEGVVLALENLFASGVSSWVAESSTAGFFRFLWGRSQVERESLARGVRRLREEERVSLVRGEVRRGLCSGVEAVVWLEVFEHFDLRSLCERALKQGWLDLAERLAAAAPLILARGLARRDCEKQARLARGAIRKAGAEPARFPSLLRAFSRAALEAMVGSGDVERAELWAESSKGNEDLETLAEVLESAGKGKELGLMLGRLGGRIKWISEAFCSCSSSETSDRLSTSLSSPNSNSPSASPVSKSPHSASTHSTLSDLSLSEVPTPIPRSRLFELDCFSPTSSVLGKPGAFLSWADFGLGPSSLLLVNADNLEEGLSFLSSARVLGLDCEFYSEGLSSLFPSRLSTLQAFDGLQTAIFDCLALNSSPRFFEKVTACLESPTSLKIGHSFAQDLRVLAETFGSSPLNPCNLLCLEEMIPLRSPISLARIVQLLFAKSLCKIEQKGPWIARPLRKTQLHYAGLDAIAVLKAYLKLSDMDSEAIKRTFAKEEVSPPQNSF